MSDFADNLKRIRLELNLSQEQFAEMLHTSKQNISRYESRQVSPKISTAAAFAEILGVSLSELNGDDNETASGKAPDGFTLHVQNEDTVIFAEHFDQLPDDTRRTMMQMFNLIHAQRRSDSDDT